MKEPAKPVTFTIDDLRAIVANMGPATRLAGERIIKALEEKNNDK